jgi:hypothetical protein
MKSWLTVIGACLVLACTSCERDCISMEARIKLVGFTPAQLSQIQLKSYPKAAGFTNAVDSVLLNAATCNCYLSNDTLELSPFINTLPGLRSTHDYQVVIPATGNSFRITAIKENFLKQNGSFTSKVACMNTLRSYTVNGIVYTAVKNESTIFLSR